MDYFWKKYNISFIVTTWSHFNHWEKCVKNIRNIIDDCPLVAELIAVDNRNDDEPEDHRHSRLHDPDVVSIVPRDIRLYADKWVTVSHSTGCGGGWNLGSQLAEGEILIFVDDQCTFDNSVALRFYDEAMKEKTGMVGVNGGYREVSEDAVTYQAMPPHAGVSTIVDEVSGFLWATPYEVFAEVGGLDPRLRPAGWEETDYAFKVRRAGYRVIRLSDCNYNHRFNLSAKRSEVRWLTTKEWTRPDIDERNKSIFFSKWAGFPSESNLEEPWLSV